MRLEVITNLEDARTLEPAWNDLLVRSPADDFFLRPDFIRLFWKTFGYRSHLRLLCLWRDHELVGLIPLCLYRKGLVRILTFVGHYPSLADRMDFILDPRYAAEARRKFLDWLFASKEWDLLALYNFGAFTRTPEELAELCAQDRRRHYLTMDDPCYFTPTTGYAGLDDFMVANVGKKTRANLRLYRNRLNKNPDALWGKDDQFDPGLLAEMITLDTESSVRGHRGECFFGDPDKTRFFKQLMEDLSGSGCYRISTLRIDGELAAYDICFIHLNKFLGYQRAYARKFHALSVGRQLNLQVLDDMIREGFEEFDFLRGGEGYKKTLAQDVRTLRRLRIYRGNALSRWLHTYHVYVKPLRRRLKQNKAAKFLVPRAIRRKLDV